MKTYESKMLEIVFDDHDKISLLASENILDNLLRYHRVERMVSTTTGEVLTDEDLEKAFEVLGALLESNFWSVQTIG